jgi:AcrR family transcriptional regulator
VTKALPIAARRDSEETRERILDALARIIVRDGLSAVGVNSLSREAGCDKVLIYRYFGDLDGVYEAYAERGDIWHSTEELLAGIDPARTSLADAIKQCIRNHAAGIRKRPLTTAVLAAELSDRTPLVLALEAVRERRGNAVTAWLAKHYEPPPGLDLPAIGLLLSAAVNYLAIRARDIRVMSGVPIKTSGDWERLLSAADRIIDSAFSTAAPSSGKRA